MRDGLANKQIARRLGISERTVKAHLTSAFSASASPTGPRLPSGRSAAGSASPVLNGRSDAAAPRVSLCHADGADVVRIDESTLGTRPGHDLTR